MFSRRVFLHHVGTTTEKRKKKKKDDNVDIASSNREMSYQIICWRTYMFVSVPVSSFMKKSMEKEVERGSFAKYQQNEDIIWMKAFWNRGK
jgi:hypothetical protein